MSECDGRANNNAEQAEIMTKIDGSKDRVIGIRWRAKASLPAYPMKKSEKSPKQEEELEKGAISCAGETGAGPARLAAPRSRALSSLPAS